MFVDKVKVSIQAGDGGDGYVSFRHEKYIDKGGPDGGNGGRGGNIIVVASTNQNTLAKFRYDKLISADPGKPGFRQNKAGRSAEDLEVLLPVGTVVTDENGVVRADLTTPGQKVIIAYGGQGGFGNAHFISSVRQAPRFAEKGEPGEAFEAVLELKMIADIGLLGLPNAGKSTLLSVITNAKPEIANYPFTTLTPNLGVAELKGGRSLLVADIPGLIEGASQGKGLGDAFLRHVDRTAVLVHCVDAYSESPELDYKTIRNELKAHSKDLARRPEVVVLTKTEGLDEDIVHMQLQRLKKVTKSTILVISAVAHKGLDELLEKCFVLVEKARSKPQSVDTSDEGVVIKPVFDQLSWTVVRRGDGEFVVSGRKIERFAVRTDMTNDEGMRRLRDIMRKMGITHELKRQGIEKGDTVIIGKTVGAHFEY
jgi:GTP-binding protein